MEEINNNDQTNFEKLNMIAFKPDELMLLRTILQEKTPHAQHACSLLKDMTK